jgi:hypothetical protein
MYCLTGTPLLTNSIFMNSMAPTIFMTEFHEDTDGAVATAPALPHSGVGVENHELVTQLNQRLAELQAQHEGQPAIVFALGEHAGALRSELVTTLEQVNGSGLSWKEAQEFGKRIGRLLNDAKKTAKETRGIPNSQALERARQKADAEKRGKRFE